MYENNFNLLRIYGAFQVLIQHSVYHLYINHTVEVEKIDNWVTSFNGFLQNFHGVAIFFLISGFLISMSYDKHPHLGEYIKNRVLRIYPALYVNFLISILVLYLFGVLDLDFEFFMWVTAQVTFFQFYNLSAIHDFGTGVINGSLWTVSVELMFYMLLPILFYIYKKSRYLIVLISILSFSLWVYDVSSSHDSFLNKLLHISIIPHLFVFIIGMGFYRYFDYLKQYIEDKFIWWFILYLLLIYTSSLLGTDEFILFFIFKWLIFSFMIFSLAFSFRGLSDRILHKNDYTYGIYIYHMIVINIFVELNLKGEVSYLFYLIAISTLLGILSWHFVEKPMLRLKNHSIFIERNKKN